MLALGFANPWLLLALLVLPVLWWLLRAMPPRPRLQRFPAVALLLGLEDKERQAATTPFWLIALRMALMAALIIGFAGPILNPDRSTPPSQALLVVMDGGWASAQGWSSRLAVAEAALERAEAAEQPAGLLLLAAPSPVRFAPPREITQRLRVLQPEPYLPQLNAEEMATLLPDQSFDVLWITGGLAWPGRAEVLDVLRERGELQLVQAGTPIWALAPPVLEEERLIVPLQHALDGRDPPGLLVEGTDPAGRATLLAEAEFTATDAGFAAELQLEPEVLARIRRFRLAGVPGAAGVALADAQLRRPEIGLVTSQAGGERLELLDPKHYLRAASRQLGRLVEAPLPVLLEANPDAIILAEDTQFTEQSEAALREWLEAGGVLIRFASGGLIERAAQGAEPFLPVSLRQGGRALGGAMSWDAPRRLAAFDPEGPFAGLSAEQDLQVLAQALAVPGPGLADAALAVLEDGTPLVTARAEGQGQIVLFHIGANAEWSNLPLTGLFPEMLSRLITPGVSSTAVEALQGTDWRADQIMDGGGQLGNAPEGLAPVSGEALGQMAVSADMPPGIWRAGDRQAVRNVLSPSERIVAADWPGDVPVLPMLDNESLSLKPYLLLLAGMLLLLDTLASFWISRGRWRGGIAALALVLLAPLPSVEAQEVERPPLDPAAEREAIAAASEVVLGHVLTGDARLDQRAAEGLAGLGQVLTARTSVEPGPPQAINLEEDDLSFYPLLYWPLSEGQAPLSEAAYDRLTTYLASGGVILFDTADGDLGEVDTPQDRALRELAAPLPVPPLVPIPPDHVLTRAFYLLAEMPGRQASGTLWVAAPATAGPTGPAAQNDGVSPVIIGGGDWAGAWAASPEGRPLYPMGAGIDGARQREIAYRFGVNLVMYVLTGNYKSDQVHVPALLERLGQ